MSDALAGLAWPAARLGEALGALARASGLVPRSANPARLDGFPSVPGGGSAGAWIEAAAAGLGLEAEPVEAAYGEVGRLLRSSAPALIQLPAGDDGSRFVALLGGGRRRMALLGPDHRRHRIAVAVVRDALCREPEARVAPEVDRLLAEAGVPERRRPHARAALLRERLSGTRIAGCWLLDLPPGAGFGRAVRRAGLPAWATSLVGAHAVQHVLLLASWWVLGRGVLQGHLDRGWLLAWALLLLTVAPFRALELGSAAVLTTRAGSLLKRRLMAGVLRLEPEEIRHQGAGQFLGQVINAEALEFLALSGGHTGLIALVEVALAVPVLALGAAGWPHAVLLLAWVGLAVFLAWRYLRIRRDWTAARLRMTHDLVERMVGHRTRLAQQRPDRLHEREDRDLEAYLETSRAMDRRAAWLKVAVPRGWLLASLVALAPGFVSGMASPAGLAIGLGGTLFAFKSFWKLVRGLSDLAEAAISWRLVAPVFAAAGRAEELPAPFLALGVAAGAGPFETLVEAHDLAFRYSERAEPALATCSLAIRPGERLLLEGPSGGGKSTLASLLVGLRVPQSGLLLLGGFDRHSLGAEGWRRRAVAAPQFQENHVLTDTFAFNLLMGRRWPPRPEDLAEAESLCRELGLGDLLDRMPAGLQQMVGESGWQLSHGEKSRLYIARALLQDAELVVLDESFAALDPESLHQAMDCVLRRARTLVVVAHP